MVKHEQNVIEFLLICQRDKRKEPRITARLFLFPCRQGASDALLVLITNYWIQTPLASTL